MEHKKRFDFLSTVSPTYVEEVLNSYTPDAKVELVRIDDACGRVFAEDVLAPEDLPYFDRSLVDGYAVVSKNSQGASETNPVMLQKKGNVKVGMVPQISVEDGECVYVNTGAYIPPGADSVVMQEFTREMESVVEILKPVYRGENIIQRGEDVKNGQIVFKKGKVITPFDIGVCAALGITELIVFKKPTVGIMSTGDEIVSPFDNAKEGKVRDVNGYVLFTLFRRLGGQIYYVGIARDEIEDVKVKLSMLRDSDMFCVSGGSSKGERDLIIEAVKELGGDILFHGVNIKPGKPFFYGLLWGKPLFGLPGHPLSCIAVTYRFVLPVFFKMLGFESRVPKTLKGILTTNVPSTYGVEEYVNVIVKEVDDKIFVEPLFAKSATISILSQSSGYIVVDQDREGYEKEEEVRVFLYEI
ncbi:MAG: molybdopterin molybdotransferase MoeA [Deltaproteobacteria bacterium]|nr:molybdopterin molybdotransferase MoeA [Deltaproteobacteria bacterium]